MNLRDESGYPSSETILIFHDSREITIQLVLMTRDDTLATIYNDRNYLVNQLNEAIVAFIYRVYACACVYVTGKFARGQRKRSEIRVDIESVAWNLR